MLPQGTCPLFVLVQPYFIMSKLLIMVQVLYQNKSVPNYWQNLKQDQLSIRPPLHLHPPRSLATNNTSKPKQTEARQKNN